MKFKPGTSECTPTSSVLPVRHLARLEECEGLMPFHIFGYELVTEVIRH